MAFKLSTTTTLITSTMKSTEQALADIRMCITILRNHSHQEGKQMLSALKQRQQQLRLLQSHNNQQEHTDQSKEQEEEELKCSVRRKIKGCILKEIVEHLHKHELEKSGERLQLQDKIIDMDQDEAQRHFLVHEVLWPLLHSLTLAYQHLDANTGENAAAPQSQQIQQQQEQDISSKSKIKSRRRPAPAPPQGLISLADYTDVACLMELLVCTSLIPTLQLTARLAASFTATGHKATNNSIMEPLKHRMARLPKAMTGRLLPSAYQLWTTPTQTPPLSPLNLSLEQSTTMQASAQEMHQTALIMAHLLFSERFQPMLLPRHLPDIYAALLQHERLVKLGIVKHRDNADGNAHPEEIRVYHTLLLRSPNRSPNISTLREQPPPPSPTWVLDDRTIALALRTLLGRASSSSSSSSSSGTSTRPKSSSSFWLNATAGRMLNDIASRDVSAILDVFVPVVLPNQDDTMARSAAARLAMTLTMTPNQDASEKQNDEKDKGFGRVVRQLVQTLLVPTDNHNQNQPEKIEEYGSWEGAGPMVLVSILSLLLLPRRNPRRGQDGRKSPKKEDDQKSGTTMPQLQQQRLHLILEELVSELLPPPPSLEDGLQSKTMVLLSSDTHVARAVRRLHHLFLAMMHYTPAGQNHTLTIMQRWCTFVVSAKIRPICKMSIAWEKGTMFETLLEIAASAPMAGLKQEVMQVLGWVVKHLSFLSSSGGCGKKENDAARILLSAASAATRTITAPSQSGNTWMTKFQPSSGGGCEMVAIRDCSFIQATKFEVQMQSQQLQEIQQRAKAVVELVVALNEEEADKKDQEEKQMEPQDTHSCARNATINPVASELFLLLLSTYVNSLSSTVLHENSNREEEDKTSYLGEAQRQLHTWASLVMLPLLCESCTMDQLMGGSGMGTLQMIAAVLSSAATAFLQTHTVKHLCFPQELSPPALEELPLLYDQERWSSLLSTASLCLAMLVAMLELGQTKRVTDEEALLQQMSPVLSQLSQVWSKDEKVFFSDETSKESHVAMMDLSEMAVHACALLAARSGHDTKQSVGQRDSVNNKDNKNSARAHSFSNFEQRLQEAKQELQSSMPPLRAKGVVQLMHMARSYVDEHDSQMSTMAISMNVNSNANTANRPLVVEMVDNNDEEKKQFHPNDVETDMSDQQLEALLQLGLVALKDEESYVYLAAIQALSAMADARPGYVMPRLALALARGILHQKKPNKQVEGSTVTLTWTQRVKVAEALLFAIRRRGEAVGWHIAALMEILLTGCGVDEESKEEKGPRPQADVSRNMHIQTEAYLRLGEYSVPSDDVFSTNASILKRSDSTSASNIAETRQQAQRLRLQTGGPLFTLEERDAIRLGCFSCLAEVVKSVSTLSSSNQVAPYISRLMKLCVEALRLDLGRPVRRGAAILAQALYHAMLQEGNAQSKNVQDPRIMPISINVISNYDEEDLLHVLLRQSVELGKDSAMVARCKEALAVREEVVTTGVFAAARLLARKENVGLSTSTAARQCVERMLDQGEQPEGVMRAMTGLKVNGENLTLEER